LTLKQIRLYIEGWASVTEETKNFVPSKEDIRFFNETAGIERILKKE